MGLFSRSDDFATSRRASQFLNVHGSDKNDGRFNIASAPMKPFTTQDQTNNERTSSTQLSQAAMASPSKTKLASVGPSIPLRTSSKDAAETSSLAQSLARKGKRLRSSASKLSLVSNISVSSFLSTTSKDVDPSRTTMQDISKPEKRNISTASISSPFHFRHLTHALPQQFNKMTISSQSELVADFSAIRASQNTRRDFRGIKTVDIHSRTSSTDTNTTSITPSEASSFQSSAPSSIVSSSHNSPLATNRSSLVIDREICSRRSRESFSQPFSPGHSPRVSMATPQSPPPRRSSRRAATQYGNDSCIRRTQVTVKPDPHSPSIHHSGADQQTMHSSSIMLEGQTNEFAEYESSHTSENQPYHSSESPISPYGRLLPCVAEEEAIGVPSARSTSIIGIHDAHHDSPSPTESCSLDSDSQASTATVTPNACVARPLHRSSLNNGLFTSWSFEDECRGFMESGKPTTPAKSPHPPLHPKPAQARRVPGSPRSRIPVRCNTTLKATN